MVSHRKLRISASFQQSKMTLVHIVVNTIAFTAPLVLVVEIGVTSIILVFLEFATYSSPKPLPSMRAG